MQRRIFFIVALLAGMLPARGLWGQEVLTGLGENPAVRQAAKQQPPQANLSRGTRQLQLPFLDDFTNPGPFPDDSLWQDRYVFVNRSYGYEHFNIGVATFDAINDTGAIYPHAVSTSFPADTLTSQPIRLDSITSIQKKLTPQDSIYLSFYIQPQGISNSPPQETDSFLVKFYAPKQQKWIHMWSMKGMDLQTFYDSTQAYYKRVMIPVTDTMFFHKGFKMMFMNYASISDPSIPSWLSGNVDIWNLNYVYMDIQRAHNDTSLMDWTLTSNAHSLLNNYEQMPWNQFMANAVAEMADTFRISYRSNRGHRRDVNMTFKIHDLSGLSSPYNTFPTPITNQNMPSFSTFDFEHVMDYVYPSNSQEYNDFQVLFHINVPDDPYNFNDTSRFYQRFYNYYAYDDGTAEAGYGLSTNGAQLAYRFNVNVEDTLRSVQMYFNRVKNNANVKPFTLIVWDDDNGVPGSIIYEQTMVYPIITEGRNKFQTYILDHPVPVNQTFYVGWQQTTGDNLNLGFDLNRNARENIFYNTMGQWINSIYQGALMIRPILGSDDYPYMDVERPVRSKQEELMVYPNPVVSGEQINLKTNIESQYLQASLYAIDGRLINEYSGEKTLPLPQLKQGVYLLFIRNLESGMVERRKIMVVK